MEAAKNVPYLKNRPESFIKSVDVILKLDSGDTLPAHSMILSLQSDALSDMLSLSESGDSRSQVLPFPDCTLDAALSLLQSIYARGGVGQFTLQGAESAAILANKFGMDNILRDVDNFLASKAASNGSSSSLWSYDVDKAVHWLNMAGNNNLLRLAAKAERFLVQASTRLSGRPEAEHIPQRSLLHMLDSRNEAIEGMQKTARHHGHKCHIAEIRCINGHKVVLPDEVQEAFNMLRASAPQYRDARSG